MAGGVNNGAAAGGDWLVPPDEQEGLRRYVNTIRERIWLIVAITVLTTLAAIAYVALATKTYEAESTLLVTPVAATNTVFEGLGLFQESSDPTRIVQTAAQLTTTIDVAERVQEELGSDQSAESLLGNVTAEPVAQTDVVAVTATGEDPEETAAIANAFARESVKNRTAQMHDQIDQILPGLQGLPEASSRLTKLEQLRQQPDPTLRVETEAAIPTVAVSPKPTLSIAAGIIAGLVLGIAAAFASQVLDTRLRREEQLRHLFRIPIIGRIPREGRGQGDRPLGPRGISPAVAEAYRTLRGTVTASRRTDGARVLLVTGSSPSEGKTTTAINLAASLSSTGRRVILIEADLRRPAISRALGIEAKRGVVGVLIESTSLQDALIDGEPLGLPNLKLLLAENEGGWISELFSLPMATTMLKQLRQVADYVIVDSPPLTDVVDALPLAREVDDVLLVVRPGTTRLGKLVQLGELLAENGIRPMGFAVVGTRRPGRGDSTYYFDQRDGLPPETSKTARSSAQPTPADDEEQTEEQSPSSSP